MTKAVEKTTTMAEEFIEDAETQFKEWLGEFNRLEETIKDAGSDVQQEYHQQLADLKFNLDDIQERLNDLKSSDADQWEERKYRFQHTSWNYQQAYVKLLGDIKAEERRPAGWLEGFTDRPPTGSAGWLEGFSARPTGSEGWVEGMAERSPKSKGWEEGYSSN